MARILLAEADRRIGGFIAGILAEFGHEVTLCADFVEADARLASEPVDVVLSDGMLGAGADTETRGIPMLSLSGRAVPACRDEPGPLPFADRPFRFGDLQHVLDAVAACSAASL